MAISKNKPWYVSPKESEQSRAENKYFKKVLTALKSHDNFLILATDGINYETFTNGDPETIQKTFLFALKNDPALNTIFSKNKTLLREIFDILNSNDHIHPGSPIHKRLKSMFE